ncbi:MAG: 23S rRNA (adenine(2503)-C(2))-methyltransferase [Rhodospirillales bacterium RIFCSPLOWO2_12_FULL_58_28]|nr:MAG: 23S rRNA (adenine(2503)-C(2))-methyltransferase [Rhodospirillales bacterium RIFCSPLOWO2_02_FULL_58_16]OHC79656.1 MAG: 23S rRNA (adenine(2503)-C(2))-methyltransferase [Rhodospirillales bacterium RIFCSPLOWO2_12_FULL_58_28]
MTGERISLLGLSRDQLAAALAEAGEKPFRAKQVWHWIYHHGETDFARMTTLSKTARGKLAEMFTVERPQTVTRQNSTDGSIKWLLRFADGNEVETVFLPEEDRGALCISTQVGCTLRCAFCHTGTQLLVRDLTAGEIVAQVMAARDAINEWPRAKKDRLLTNIVVMGMGEPLFNYEQVAKALMIIMDGEGLSISKRRITLSTSGVVPMFRRLGEETGVNLAVSLHAPNDELRNKLVPINKKYPLKELIEACREYPGAHNARRITIEYIMLKDVNDTPEHARELVRLVKGLPVKFNLLPFNEWPGAPFKCSTPETITSFAEFLNNAGYSAPIRNPRGRDIMAACGQLRSVSRRERLSRHKARLAAGIE